MTMRLQVLYNQILKIQNGTETIITETIHVNTNGKECGKMKTEKACKQAYNVGAILFF